jgi:hypothetical protein
LSEQITYAGEKMALQYEKHPLLVLIGAFNQQIMRNPPWIKNYLFPLSPQKEITVNMNLPIFGGELSSSMEIDGIRIVAESGKIQFTPKEFNVSGYNALSDVIVNLSSALPHTPLFAYGINCRFLESSSKAFFMNKPLFKKLFEADYFDNYLKLEYAHNYKDSKMTVSVVEKKTEDLFQICYDFNFHFQLGENEKSPMMILKNRIIDGAIERYLNHAKEIAETISLHINSKGKGKKNA